MHILMIFIAHLQLFLSHIEADNDGCVPLVTLTVVDTVASAVYLARLLAAVPLDHLQENVCECYD